MTDQTDRHKAALTDRYVIVREPEALPPTPGRAVELGQIYPALGTVTKPSGGSNMSL